MAPDTKPGAKGTGDLKSLFGQRLRDLRERAGMSQQDLSNASGVSKVFLGTVERSEKAVGLEAVEKLAKGLGVEAQELFRFESREDDPVENVLRRIATLARGSRPKRLARFERIARAFFEPDEEAPVKGKAR